MLLRVWRVHTGTTTWVTGPVSLKANSCKVIIWKESRMLHEFLSSLQGLLLVQSYALFPSYSDDRTELSVKVSARDGNQNLPCVTSDRTHRNLTSSGTLPTVFRQLLKSLFPAITQAICPLLFHPAPPGN